MSVKIDPEAAEPTTIQDSFLSDRNPAVEQWGGTEAVGGQIATPPAGAQRVTPEGAAVSPDAGLRNYDVGDAADTVEDEAEREG